MGVDNKMNGKRESSTSNFQIASLFNGAILKGKKIAVLAAFFSFENQPHFERSFDCQGASIVEESKQEVMKVIPLCTNGDVHAPIRLKNRVSTSPPFFVPRRLSLNACFLLRQLYIIKGFLLSLCESAFC